MTDREPVIGDVIMEKRGGPWGHSHLAVDAATINAAREWVVSGHWVIVDKNPHEEQKQ